MLLIATAAFWAIELLALRTGTPDPLDDTWEYGLAARSVLAGRGFRTAVIHPPLWTLRDSALTVPVLIHGPLVPLLVAPAVARAPADPRALDGIAWLAALCATLAAGAIAAHGARRRGAAFGIAAAIAFTLSPLTLHSVHHDVSPVLGALLFAWALELATAARAHPIAAGIVLGLGWLARPEMLVAAPILALASRGWRARGLLLAAFAVVAAPWALHNLRAAGSPVFNLSSYLAVGYSSRWPGISVLREFAIPPAHWPAVLRHALPALPHKWAETLPHALKRMLLAPSGATGWLAALGALAALRTPGERRAAWFGLAFAAIPLAIMVATLYDLRYVVPFLPLWSLAAARGAEALSAPLATRPAARAAPALALTLLLLPAALPALAGDAAMARALCARLERERASLAALPAVQPMFSDTPDFVAWTTRRSTVWVSRPQYQALPACTGAPTAAAVVPCRRDPREAWFHATGGR